MLTSRQIDILKVIISDFIDEAIPVGSKTLKSNHELPYSSATIRNEMAYLEEVGLLEKTHTSSGRIPSNQGYRYYVDYLLDESELDDVLIKRLEELFNNRKLEIEEVVKETCNLISSMTNYTSVALGADSKDEILARLELIPVSTNSVVVLIVTTSGKTESKIFSIDHHLDLEEILKCVKVMNKMLVGTKLCDIVARIEGDIKDELAKHVTDYEFIVDAFVNAFIKFSSDNIYVSGRNNIINQPDFNDIDKIRNIVNVMEDHDFFEELAKHIDGPAVMIGQESNKMQIDDVAIVTSNYDVNENERGVIAIIGPTRMDYDKMINLLDYVSIQISQLIKEQRGGSSE